MFLLLSPWLDYYSRIKHKLQPQQRVAGPASTYFDVWEFLCLQFFIDFSINFYPKSSLFDWEIHKRSLFLEFGFSTMKKHSWNRFESIYCTKKKINFIVYCNYIFINLQTQFYKLARFCRWMYSYGRHRRNCKHQDTNPWTLLDNFLASLKLYKSTEKRVLLCNNTGQNWKLNKLICNQWPNYLVLSAAVLQDNGCLWGYHTQLFCNCSDHRQIVHPVERSEKKIS